MIRKLAFAFIALILMAAPVAAADNQSGVDNVSSFDGFHWWAMPSPLNSDDSTAIANAIKDTTTDTLGAAGADSGWYDLGPCPSNQADSGVLGIVVGGTGGAVGCSLFVSTSQRKAYAYPAFLNCIAYDGNVITDSLNGVTNGIYPIPWDGKRGARLWAKFYTYSGASAIALKRVFVIRDDR